MAERDEVPRGGVPVGEIMIDDPVSIPPGMPTTQAIKLMREKQIGALPVVREGQLVGIITESDFIEIAGQLLNENLDEPPSADGSIPSPEAST
jgi:CBS domain-containing protein